MRHYRIVSLPCLLACVLLVTQPSPSSLQPQPSPDRAGPAAIYPRTETGSPNPKITQDNIRKNICNKKWKTDLVRPSTSVTGAIKRKKMKEYGYTDTGLHYELDHLISLQVGGCPACEDNLWPQPYGDASHRMTEVQRSKWNAKHPNSSGILPGSLEKDIVENYVHDEVCHSIPNAKMSSYSKKFPPSVTITLKRGQEILSTDWYDCYLKMLDHKPCQ